MNPVFRKPWQIPLLLLVFLAQWAVPLSQVYQEESVRREGTLFRLELTPVDPYDLMRGRYLALSFAASNTSLPVPASSKKGDTVYAVLQENEKGLAYPASLSPTPGENTFAIKLGDVDEKNHAQIDIPLTRFYLPEDDALALDSLFTGTNGEAARVRATLNVRLKDNRLVAESLLLNDRPYHEWLRDYVAKQKTP